MGRGMRVVDLSHAIAPGMPVWPGSRGPESTPVATIGRDGFAERRLCFSSHAGTHLDAPSHLFDDGKGLDSYEAGWFVGKALVVDVSTAAGGIIGRGLLEPWLGRIPAEGYLLLRSGWSRFWGSAAYDSGYPVLDTTMADALAGIPFRGVGIDCPSFDLPSSSDLPVHRRLLGSGLLLVENLTALHLLPDSGFTISVLPLPVSDAEACPTRAVAML